MKNISLLYYWLVLYRRRFSIFGIIGCAIVSSVVLSLFYPATYEAQTVFFIPTNDTNQGASFFAPTGVADIKQQALLPADKDTGLKPYIGYLKGRDLAIEVQKDFPQKPLKNYLRNDMDFEVTEEGLLRIYSRDRNAQRAADIATSYLKHLNELIAGLTRKSLESNVAVLDSNIESLRTQMAANETKTAEFLAQRNVASFTDESKTLTSIKASIQSSLDSNEVRSSQNAAKIAATTAELNKEGALLKEGTFDFTDPVIESLKDSLNKLGAEIASRNVKVGTQNVELESLRAQYAETETRLRKQIDQLIGSQVKPTNSAFEQLRVQIVGLLVEEADLHAEREGNLKVLDNIAARVAAYVGASPEFDQLSLEGQTLRNSFEQLLLSSNETNIQLARKTNFLAIVDPPAPPAQPSFPVLPLNVAVAILVGFGLAIAYAFFMNYVDDVDRVSTRSMIRALLAKS